MRWNRRYGLKSYVGSALWIVPFVAIPIELVISRIAHWLDPRLGWTLLGYTQQGAQALLEALVTMTLSFVVFTFASLLVAIQIAGGQLTPRIIATTLLRDDLVRYTVGLFLFTLLFALRAQDQMAGGGVHQAVIFLAATLGLFCLAAFLYLIDHAARLLRPISIFKEGGRRRPHRHRQRLSGAGGGTTIGFRPAAVPRFARPDHSSRRDIRNRVGG